MNAILAIVKYRFWVVILLISIIFFIQIHTIKNLGNKLIEKKVQVAVLESKNQALKAQSQKDKIFYESKIANYKKSLETKPKEIAQLKEITMKGEDNNETECKNIDDILSDYRSIYKLH